MKEERKASLLGGGAGWSPSYRVVGLARGTEKAQGIGMLRAWELIYQNLMRRTYQRGVFDFLYLLIFDFKIRLCATTFAGALAEPSKIIVKSIY